jgi:hypothetical protein
MSLKDQARNAGVRKKSHLFMKNMHMKYYKSLNQVRR